MLKTNTPKKYLFKNKFGFPIDCCCLYPSSIDVLDFAVSNPRLKATQFQKQKWVMVRKREEVKAVRAMVKDKKLHPLIQPDNIDVGEWDDTQPEITDSGMVTVYIRFFRIDGEVYFTKETKNVVLCQPTPLNPYVVYEMKNKPKKKK